MNPKSLTLIGFIGIRSGLNRDEITIDFDALAGDASLIAIVGPNGAGKSTILDNMHPYRVMPSRAGGYSPTAFSYYDQTYGAQAAKHLVWEHCGATYKSVILIKVSGKSRKQECYLQIKKADQWVAATLADGSPVDGKTEAYDRAIEEILGSCEMYFTAAFSCQGKRTLASYANSDIKALMSDLLGLEKYLELSRKAHEVTKTLGTHREIRASSLERLPGLEDGLSHAVSALEDEQQLLGNLNLDKVQASDVASLASRKLAEAQGAHAESAQIERRRQTLNSQIEAITKRAKSDMDAATAAAEKMRDSARLNMQMAASSQSRTTIAKRRAEEGLQKAREVLSLRESIEKAVGLKKTLEFAVKTEADAVEAARVTNDKRKEAQASLGLLQSELQALVQSGKALADNFNELRARAGLIKEVPCYGMGMASQCKLLAEANAAAQTLPSREEELTAKRARRTTLMDAIEKAEQEIAAYGDTEKALRTSIEVLRTATDESNHIAVLAARAFELESAATMEADLIASISEYDLQAVVDSMDIETANKALAGIVDDLKAKLKEIEAQATLEQDVIAVEILALPPTNPEELKAAERAAEVAAKRVTELQESIDRVKANIAKLEATITASRANIETMADQRRYVEHLDREIANFTLLSKALGRDGIVALCIDDAGPTLASIANDLLTACYGPRFTIAIQTQEETAAGTMHEVFDIRVFDSERDDVKSISAVSGGEAVWINEAMTRAIALYRSQSSGRAYECLFSDESDGALDPEKKTRLVDMKRKVLEIGGYAREFFISHTPAVVELADATIDLGTFRL